MPRSRGDDLLADNRGRTDTRLRMHYYFMKNLESQVLVLAVRKSEIHFVQFFFLVKALNLCKLIFRKSLDTMKQYLSFYVIRKND